MYLLDKISTKCNTIQRVVPYIYLCPSWPPFLALAASETAVLGQDKVIHTKSFKDLKKPAQLHHLGI